MKYVKGPDLPTGGEIITPRADLLAIYNTGNGSYKARATYSQEDDIIVDQLPYQVSGNKVLEQIARRCARRSCRWWRICVTSRTTRTRRAS